MSSIKQIVVVGIFIAAGVGLYFKINSGPEPIPPEDFSGTWGAPPAIEMAGMDGAASPQQLEGEGSASEPSFGAPDSSAPPFGSGNGLAANGGASDSQPPAWGGGPADPQGGVPWPGSPTPDVGSSGNRSYGAPVADGSVSQESPPALPGTSAGPNAAHAPSVSDPLTGQIPYPQTGTPDQNFPIGTPPGQAVPDAVSDGPSLPSLQENGAPLTGTDRNELGTTGEGQVTPDTSATRNLYARSIPASLRDGSSPAESLATPSAVDPSQTTFEASRQAADVALKQGRVAEAHITLSRWYGHPSLSSADQLELSNLLGQLAGTVIYSTGHHLEPAHIVREGESLASIAEVYHVPDKLLARINGIDPNATLQPGQNLKVVRGPFSAVVRLEQRELALMIGSYYAGRFPIGIGRERPNMEGQWIVKHKETNPVYYGRDRVIDRDDVSNPLGEHWVGLASANQETTVEPFGIHGTNDSQSIRQDDPRGYIRLSPNDAEDLYDILSIGSRVTIVR